MEILFKIFIKNKDNTEDEKVRQSYGVFSGFVGIFLNIVLFGIKLFAGLITGSVGIVADALNNISDAGSSIITLVGFKLSGKPAHNDHPFGHGRFEYITGLFVSIAILFMGVEILKSSFSKIVMPQAITFRWISVIILVVSVIVKAWMYFFNKKVGLKIDSSSMIATAKDSLSDSISTGAVLLGTLIAYFANINIDGYIGLIVSLFIIYTGINSIREAISPLLGTSPDPELVKRIEEIVMSHEGVIGIHDMVIHDYGPTRFMVSLHTEVPANINIIEMHDRIDHIERELRETFGCDAVIHLDPIDINNEVVNEKKEIIKKILFEISQELTFHDFRIVSGPTHTNLIFDVVIPFNFKMTQEELKAEIDRKVREYDDSHFIVVDFDRALS
ncbi:MAG: cation transporter [Clostridia bacterium]|nr:cation transporter [Clostridia bacterium]